MSTSRVKEIEGLHFRTGECVSLRIEGPHIAEVRQEPCNRDEATPWIGPGLVDLQVNGYGGLDLNTLPMDDELVEGITRRLWREGVTAYMPTVITNSDEALEEAVRAIAKACVREEYVERAVVGIHLEGPFVSPEDGPRGAHPKEHVRAPDWSLFQRLQEAAGGRIRVITLSPEWPGSGEFIARCVESGVKVSIGHTAATPEQIDEAVKAGARMSTHLGNAAHLMLPRHPNYIWEQLANDALWAGVIADGFHLPESVLKVVLAVKRHRVMLVSDVVFLGGMEPGAYETHVGGKVVLSPEGKLHLAENPKMLAGSARTIREGVEHLVRSRLSTLPDAWEMASVRPARFMDLPSVAGLSAGAPADVVVFRRMENMIRVLRTYNSGNLVYDAEEDGVEEGVAWSRL